MANIDFNLTQQGGEIIRQAIQQMIEYNDSISKELFEICQPLLCQIFNASTFEYGRFFKDGSFYYLSTNPKWHTTYLQKFSNSRFIINHMKVVIEEKRSIHVWDVNPLADKELSSFITARRECGIWHDFTIYKHDDISVEWYSFAADEENTINVNTYLNNVKYFHNFIVYFNERASYLINNADSKRIVAMDYYFLSDNSFDKYSEKRKICLEMTRLSKYRFDTPRGEVILTFRENQCLGYKSRGMKNKDIATIIGVSVGTVNVFFERIRQKSYGLTLSKLVNIYSKSPLYNLSLGDL